MSKTIWVGAVAYNPKVVTIWEGMRGYFHEEAHLPVEIVAISELRSAGHCIASVEVTLFEATSKANTHPEEPLAVSITEPDAKNRLRAIHVRHH